jgi:hypothetical protein
MGAKLDGGTVRSTYKLQTGKASKDGMNGTHGNSGTLLLGSNKEDTNWLVTSQVFVGHQPIPSSLKRVHYLSLS